MFLAAKAYHAKRVNAHVLTLPLPEFKVIRESVADAPSLSARFLIGDRVVLTFPQTSSADWSREKLLRRFEVYVLLINMSIFVHNIA